MLVLMVLQCEQRCDHNGWSISPQILFAFCQISAKAKSIWYDFGNDGSHHGVYNNAGRYPTLGDRQMGAQCIYLYLFQGNKMKQDGRKYFDDFSALCVCVCMFSCVVCSCHVSIFFHPILDLVEISLIVSQHWIWNRRKLYRLYSSYLQQKGYPLIRLWVLTVAHMIWETRFLL